MLVRQLHERLGHAVEEAGPQAEVAVVVPEVERHRVQHDQLDLRGLADADRADPRRPAPRHSYGRASAPRAPCGANATGVRYRWGGLDQAVEQVKQRHLVQVIVYAVVPNASEKSVDGGRTRGVC